MGRKEKEPSFTEIQILSFTHQMVSVLGDKSDLCITVCGRRPFAVYEVVISITGNIIRASLKKQF